MKVERRDFLKTLLVSGSLSSHRLRATGLIDRSALVKRHNPVLRKLDPLSPLSLGNGEFAFTADITGLQTFPQHYDDSVPLCTMSQWGWHAVRLPPGLDPKAFRLTEYDSHGRHVGYPTSAEGQTELYNWLRENPHRLHLGRIGLRFEMPGGRDILPTDLTRIEQELDLWSGVLTSRFAIEGKPVTVRTAVHPDQDQLAAAIESPLIEEGRLAIRIDFPYGSPAMQAADWRQAAKHQSRLINESPSRVELHRVLDADEYFATIGWGGEASFAPEAPHYFRLIPARHGGRFEFTAAFAPRPPDVPLPSPQATFARSATAWERFWTEGGAIELADSRDTRASELERRVVLSQYLTAIQCAGSLPPQESGLLLNSWHGKFHLEMHWWHAAHFALWNRLHLLERSLGWYVAILPAARDLARAQGYAGARWPKMVGPEGRDSPSPIGPLLIWQQAHPIFFAELCYLAHANRETLERYRPIVFESADFMTSFAFFDHPSRRYVLGPPVIPAQENHPPRETWNPAFELAYWRFGLTLAQRWRERLGMKRDRTWASVISNLSPLPVRDGVYVAHENDTHTFTTRNYDHPSMLGALGMLPGNGVDRETMRRTLVKVMKHWQWDRTWGWDYPLTAMTAARVGEPDVAIAALLMTTDKNRFLPNGHNWQRANLPCYLPGNGGLLYAAAMMAAGWQGAGSAHAPGFPSDGSWTVRWEGLRRAL